MGEIDVPGMLTSHDTLLASAAERAHAYLRGDRRDDECRRPPKPSRRWTSSTSRCPNAASTPGRTLALLDDVGSPATVATNGPRYFGFVNGGALPIAVATSWILAAWDQNATLRIMSPVAARLEAVALRWLTELFGLPAGVTGGFVTGATMADAGPASRPPTTRSFPPPDGTRQHTASSARLRSRLSSPRSPTRRSTRRSELVGLAGPARHGSPSTTGRVCPTGLPSLTRPAIVCLQAGNVNSGASDPFVPLVESARQQGAWIHVDGAFGLWAAASPKLARQVTGIDGADSWATDAHKWLNTTYDCGTRSSHPDALRSSMRAQAAYLLAEQATRRWSSRPSRHSGHTGPRSGRSSPHSAVTGSPRSSSAPALAGRFAEGLAAAGIRVLNDVTLNQVVVDFGDPGSHRRGHRRRAGRWHLLVRPDDLAGASGDAHLAQLLGDDGERRRSEPRHGHPLCLSTACIAGSSGGSGRCPSD